VLSVAFESMRRSVPIPVCPSSTGVPVERPHTSLGRYFLFPSLHWFVPRTIEKPASFRNCINRRGVVVRSRSNARIYRPASDRRPVRVRVAGRIRRPIRAQATAAVPVTERSQGLPVTVLRLAAAHHRGAARRPAARQVAVSDGLERDSRRTGSASAEPFFPFEMSALGQQQTSCRRTTVDTGRLGLRFAVSAVITVVPFLLREWAAWICCKKNG
jgi:hypothetical protein